MVNKTLTTPNTNFKITYLDTQNKMMVIVAQEPRTLKIQMMLPFTQNQLANSLFHSDYVTMTQAVSQPEHSSSQTSNREPSIICLAKESGRPLIHANSLPQTELSNKFDKRPVGQLVCQSSAKKLPSSHRPASLAITRPSSIF